MFWLESFQYCWLTLGRAVLLGVVMRLLEEGHWCRFGENRLEGVGRTIHW